MCSAHFNLRFGRSSLRSCIARSGFSLSLNDQMRFIIISISPDVYCCAARAILGAAREEARALSINHYSSDRIIRLPLRGMRARASGGGSEAIFINLVSYVVLAIIDFPRASLSARALAGSCPGANESRPGRLRFELAHLQQMRISEAHHLERGAHR